jgi:hypothetical protein
VARTLRRGCPRLMKMVELAQDQHFVNQKRKSPYQYATSPKPLAISHNAYTKGGQNLMFANIKNKST